MCKREVAWGFKVNGSPWVLVKIPIFQVWYRQVSQLFLNGCQYRFHQNRSLGHTYETFDFHTVVKEDQGGDSDDTVGIENTLHPVDISFSNSVATSCTSVATSSTIGACV